MVFQTSYTAEAYLEYIWISDRVLNTPLTVIVTKAIVNLVCHKEYPNFYQVCRNSNPAAIYLFKVVMQTPEHCMKSVQSYNS